ncbi:MAG: PIG-L family deacetylase [Bryobacterales bacterium]|nr:PIG-L family deacetylase [Bryobacterales bacterium]
MRLLSLALAIAQVCSTELWAQPNTYSAAEIQLRLRKLATLGSVLHIAAHPDDENTLLLAYFARERSLRTGYLSLTRGEGGQNLIGPEQGSLMGLIRTQELLAARRMDGAEQFFTRATDFGFSKTAEETLRKWGREEVLGDIVWVIRRFRPDVIFLRFSGTPRDGHGQHQASALLARDAFEAAGDGSRFPEQLGMVKPHRAKRLFFNLFNFTPEMEKENRAPQNIEIDAGGYNPLLGLSYGEIEGRSRSQHASQGMGWPERRGARLNHLRLIAGERAEKDPFEGIDTSWKRVAGGARLAALTEEAIRRFDPARPQAILPLLGEARGLIAAIGDGAAEGKLREVEELMAACAGLWLDASAARHAVTAGSRVAVNLEIVKRLPAEVTLVGVTVRGAAAGAAQWKDAALPTNQRLTETVTVTLPEGTGLTQPFWLRAPMAGTLYRIAEREEIGKAENDALLRAEFRFRMAGVEFGVERAVHHRYVDNVRGELTRPLTVAPAVAVEIAEAALVFGDGKARDVAVTVKANTAGASGEVALAAGAGWRIEPASRPYALGKENEQASLRFTIYPPVGESTVRLQATATGAGGTFRHGMRVIAYPHIPPITFFPEASATLVRTEVKVLSRRIGYVMGAGDQVPEALRQLGLEVTLLADEELAAGELGRYDAIVCGVRAYNTRAALRANRQRLLDYVSAGGTYVVQYNVVEGFGPRAAANSLESIGPYPLTVGRGRVTVEDSPVNLADHALLRRPNAISKRDFEGWVQERGLYYAEKFDGRYSSLFATQDPGEDWQPGGMLTARYGKGAFVFTAYSWFRQLPAGVPGAYRIFANLISAGKVE